MFYQTPIQMFLTKEELQITFLKERYLFYEVIEDKFNRITEFNTILKTDKKLYVIDPLLKEIYIKDNTPLTEEENNILMEETPIYEDVNKIIFKFNVLYKEHFINNKYLRSVKFNEENEIGRYNELIDVILKKTFDFILERYSIQLGDEGDFIEVDKNELVKFNSNFFLKFKVLEEKLVKREEVVNYLMNLKVEKNDEKYLIYISKVYFNDKEKIYQINKQDEKQVIDLVNLELNKEPIFEEDNSLFEGFDDLK